MSVIQLLIFLSVSSMASSLEEAVPAKGAPSPLSLQEAGFDIGLRKEAYDQLIGERNNIACASPKAIRLYNKLCGNWNCVLKVVVPTDLFQPIPLDVENTMDVVGPSEQFKAALTLFYNKDCLNALKSLPVLKECELVFLDNSLVELKAAITDIVPEGAALHECIRKFAERDDWFCTDVLACAAASMCVENAPLLKGVNVKFCEFLESCWKVWLARSEEVRALFAPLEDLIRGVDTPTCNAVKEIDSTAKRLRDYFGTSTQPCGRSHCLTSSYTLYDALCRVQEGSLVNKLNFEFAMLLRGGSMDSFWTDIFSLKEVRSLLFIHESWASRSVSLMEEVAVSETYIAEFCLAFVYAQPAAGFVQGCAVVGVDTLSRFWGRKDVDTFSRRLAALPAGKSMEEDPVGMYLNFLEKGEGVDWWSVVLGVLKGRSQQIEVRKDPRVAKAYWHIWRRGVDLREACQFLRGVHSHTTKMQATSVEVDIAKANLICTACCMAKREGSLWKSGGQYIKEINMCLVDELLNVLDEIMPQKTREFFRFAVLCLPNDDMLPEQCSDSLLGGAIYSQLIVGKEPLNFIVDMVRSEIHPGNSTAEAYLRYLSNEFSVKKLFNILSDLLNVSLPIEGEKQWTSALCPRMDIARCVWSVIRDNKCYPGAHLSYLKALIVSEQTDGSYVRQELQVLCSYIQQKEQVASTLSVWPCWEDFNSLFASGVSETLAEQRDRYCYVKGELQQ